MWHHAVRLKKVSSWNKVCKGTLRDPRFDQNTVRDSGQHKILTGNEVWRGSSKYGRGMPDFLAVCREKFGRSIANGEIKQEKIIKHLGLHKGTRTLVGSSTDIIHISKKKIKRWIAALSKIRYFVSQQVLVQLYYTLIYPVLTYIT